MIFFFFIFRKLLDFDTPYLLISLLFLGYPSNIHHLHPELCYHCFFCNVFSVNDVYYYPIWTMLSVLSFLWSFFHLIILPGIFFIQYTQLSVPRYSRSKSCKRVFKCLFLSSSTLNNHEDFIFI